MTLDMRRYIAPALFAISLEIYCGGAMLVATGGAAAQELKLPELPKMPKLPELPKGPPEVPVEYFVAVDGKQSGPFKCKKLFEMANQHVLTPESKVWKSGMQNWRRAAGMADLDAIFAAVPPPVNDDSSPAEAKQPPNPSPCDVKPPVKHWWWPF